MLLPFRFPLVATCGVTDCRCALLLLVLWSAEGQNFVADHSSPNIDFMSIHLWMNNWEDKTTEFLKPWIQQHIQDAKASLMANQLRLNL